MPRKYEKKTKGNFRTGRPKSRHASVELDMIPAGFSIYGDEFDPTVDETLLMLNARGMGREQERFSEAIGEIRDRISRVSGVFVIALRGLQWLNLPV